jgi:hypothetical protein
MSLSREEDAELRRLGLFEKHGLLRGDATRVFEQLRARDRRSIVRDQDGEDFDWLG